MYREFDFTTQLVESFSAYHRQSYACKVGVGDVLIVRARRLPNTTARKRPPT
jgi:4-hydroxybutyryl-CoA dehydratase/vinylacetyl-CoA-Delta-isomerase